MTDAYAYLPVIDKDQAALIPPLLEQFESAMGPSSDDQIERMIAKLALLYPSVKLSDAEAEARLELYIELLRDIPFDCLSAAFRTVAQTHKFFPTVAEIREAAAEKVSERRSRYYGLRTLLLKHRQEWSPPFDESQRCKPEEAAEIIRKFGIGLSESAQP